MDVKIVSYVMSGGAGSRLWPLSREDFPKQFHDFSGQGSMLARTLARIGKAGKAKNMPVYIIGSEAHESRLRTEVAGQSLHGGKVVLEPIGRNTAAAVALATHITLHEYDSALMLIAPSDHEIVSDDDFWADIETGVAGALRGRIVTFGITPDRPETGYGYIETSLERRSEDGLHDAIRFVEKPDLPTAKDYLASGRFLWNSGIFLFSSQTIKEHFEQFAPQIWEKTGAAYAKASKDVSTIWLPYDAYHQIPVDSVDCAIMERSDNVALVPARFRWNDLGSWQALLDLHNAQTDTGGSNDGNVIVGDVVAIDCTGSYLRSQSGLLSAIGLKNMAVVKTADATFVAPVEKSQHVRQLVATLEKSGRMEAKFTPSPDHPLDGGVHAARVHHWLYEEALPLWTQNGIDEKGGFHEKLSFDGHPLVTPKRMRTMARQIYVFAKAHEMGWDGNAFKLVEHGWRFLTQKGRSPRGGWISSFDAQGNVLDTTEDLYDQAFVLLALAHSIKAGYYPAMALLEETLTFLDTHLKDQADGGFFETPERDRPYRRSNPHMHLLESFLSCFALTGEADFLERARHIITLFQSRFFDAQNWSLGEYFTHHWQPTVGEQGDICEPGHHFEWAWLLVQYTTYSGETQFLPYARKLYATALAYGINRTTGLCFNTIEKSGRPLECNTRSWQQSEILKAAVALDGMEGHDFRPEIEMRVGRLFRWHVEPAPKGLWIDAIDANGHGLSRDVPASILYHLVCAFTAYLDFTATSRPTFSSP